MRPTGITTDINAGDISAAREFYSDYLGLTNEALNHGRVVDLAARRPGPGSVRQRRRGFEIVQPLTTEEWGVRRFLVPAPDGTVIKMVSHADTGTGSSRR